MSSAAKIPVIAADAVLRQYGLWARDYDDSANPLLSLEERFLTPLLPCLANQDVVDVGCGTGRWLFRLANSGARRLTGIDRSPDMLDRAKRKLGRKARIVLGDAIKLPIASRSTDVVLASFVASYVADLRAFAAEFRRVVRDGGRVYVADVHPQTEVSLHWKRAFRVGKEQVRLTTCSRTLTQIISHLNDEGLRVRTLLEPCFGVPELETFRQAGRLDSYYAAADMPAIYILELSVSKKCRVSVACEPSPVLFQRARISLDANTAAVSDIAINNCRIEAIQSTTPTSSAANAIDLRGYLVLPGLINAHDHLDFGLYPNLGYPPYKNFTEWAADIHKRDGAAIAAQKSIPRDVQVWWGAIRNLLCGVTTVCHHNPLYPELLANSFPLKIVNKYEWAHSLAIDPELNRKCQSSSVPFVVHAAEGIDEKAEREVYALDELGALNEHTVFVHGLGLDANGIALLNRRSASLVLCPSSNQFLFGRTLSQQAIGSTNRVLLGSDSPLTARGDLVDDIGLAYRQIGVPAPDVYQMVFENSPAALGLSNGEGRIRPGGTADIVAVRDSGLDPAQTLVNLSAADIELVVVRGDVQVVSDRIFRKMPAALTEGLKPLQVESMLRWVRAPLGRLFREAERALGCDLRVGGKRMRHVCTTWI